MDIVRCCGSRERQLSEPRAVIEPGRDRFLDAARGLAAKDRNGLADPEDMATELGIGLYEVTELVHNIRPVRAPSESAAA